MIDVELTARSTPSRQSEGAGSTEWGTGSGRPSSAPRASSPVPRRSLERGAQRRPICPGPRAVCRVLRSFARTWWGEIAHCRGGALRRQSRPPPEEHGGPPGGSRHGSHRGGYYRRYRLGNAWQL